MLVKWYAQHRKLVVFILGAALTLATDIWGPSNHWIQFGALALTGLGVYQFRNDPLEVPAATPVQPTKKL
jgi:hypothetical protein